MRGVSAELCQNLRDAAFRMVLGEAVAPEELVWLLGLAIGHIEGRHGGDADPVGEAPEAIAIDERVRGPLKVRPTG